MNPRSEKLTLPKGYGRTATSLPWEAVRAKLEEARTYWLACARPDGRPHVVPLDGIWLDDMWFYGGAEDTVHMRTVRANPRATMHLPDPFDVVIVEGEVRRAEPSTEFAQRLAEASNAKYPDYGYSSQPEAYADALALFPQRVVAWSSFPKDATRFVFDR